MTTTLTAIKAIRPKILHGSSTKIKTACGNVFVIVNMHEGKPFEVLVKLGKAGGCPACQLEALTRCITLGLRCGIPAEDFIDSLSNLKCPGGMYQAGEQELYIHSCPDAIAHVLKTVTKSAKNAAPIHETTNPIIAPDSATKKKPIKSTPNISIIPNGSTCPDCGTVMMFAEGCVTCPSCGYSKCG